MIERFSFRTRCTIVFQTNLFGLIFLARFMLPSVVDAKGLIPSSICLAIRWFSRNFSRRFEAVFFKILSLWKSKYGVSQMETLHVFASSITVSMPEKNFIIKTKTTKVVSVSDFATISKEWSVIVEQVWSHLGVMNGSKIDFLGRVRLKKKVFEESRSPLGTPRCSKDRMRSPEML